MNHPIDDGGEKQKTPRSLSYRLISFQTKVLKALIATPSAVQIFHSSGTLLSETVDSSISRSMLLTGTCVEGVQKPLGRTKNVRDWSGIANLTSHHSNTMRHKKKQRIIAFPHMNTLSSIIIVLTRKLSHRIYRQHRVRLRPSRWWSHWCCNRGWHQRRDSNMAYQREPWMWRSILPKIVPRSVCSSRTQVWYPTK